MVIQKNCSFIKNNQNPVVSKAFFNTTGDILSLQIDGANGVYWIEGRNNTDHNWVPLAGINLSDFSMVKGSYTQTGMYEIGIIGIRELRARVESAQGEVSIFG